MSQHLIVEQRQFDDFCAHARSAGIVAFDTEFVSEHSYRPELCLLQFATTEQQVAVDPYEVQDLSAWWDIMVDPDVTVIVHGGQAEVRFCIWACDKAPKSLVDIQLAEGLQSRSYPLGYAALVQRVLGKSISSKATRTDWRRRPLSDEQIEYAIDDVRFVPRIWQTQEESLTRLGRRDWALTEFDRYVQNIEKECRELSWHKLSGIQRLNRRELAVAIRLFEWRESQAEIRNRQPRRVLRDDLLLEMARRKPANVQQLMATRDMNRADYRRVAEDIVAVVQEAMDLPDKELPDSMRSRQKDNRQDEQVLGKLLSIALANRCAEQNVSMQLVATSSDLRLLVRRHVYQDQTVEELPLQQGWRAQVCGDLLTDVLDGRIVLRVADPESDHPLVFERIDPRDPE